MARIQISSDIELHVDEEPNLMAIVDLRNGNIVVMTHVEVSKMTSYIIGFFAEGLLIEEKEDSGE